MPHLRPPASDDTPHKSHHHNRHLLSTFFIAIWTVFIVATIVIHEIAHRAAWKYGYFLSFNHGSPAPWVYRHGTGLPGLLRTAFAQVHAPITAMHLNRLAVNMLETSWASPKTWMEVFWLADRRWAGPFGLGKTGWTIVSRRLRVSFGFILLACLNIVTLVTPVFMTRAYSVATDYVSGGFAENASMIDLPTLARLSSGIQITTGNEIWTKGLSSALIFPRNSYRTPEITEEGWYFFTGELPNQSESSLTGIFVGGRCSSILVNLLPPKQCNDGVLSLSDIGRPASSWDVDVNSSIPSVGPAAFSLISVSGCSDIDLSMPFRQSTVSTTGPGRSPKWAGAPLAATFQFRSNNGNFSAYCDVAAAPGIASVDSSRMSFKHFASVDPDYHSESIFPVHPLGAIQQTDWIAFQQSINLKLDRILNSSTPEGDLEDIIGLALWEGVLSMSAAIWIKTALPAEVTGTQRYAKAGIQRDNVSFRVLIALLGIWFVGMVTATAVLLRPAWTGSMDGYAAARMLQHQPNLVLRPESLFADLEENSDMLKPFVPNHMR